MGAVVAALIVPRFRLLQPVAVGVAAKVLLRALAVALVAVALVVAGLVALELLGKATMALPALAV